MYACSFEREREREREREGRGMHLNFYLLLDEIIFYAFLM